jgi:hypothetical protein
MYATALTHDAGQAMFGAMDGQLALAASTRPVAERAAVDKALQMQGLQARTNYEVAQAMQGSARRMIKSNEALREKLMAAGATLV